jgi:hypothetical protein
MPVTSLLAARSRRLGRALSASDPESCLRQCATGTGEVIDLNKLILENQELRKAIATLKQQIADLESRSRE